MELLKLAALWCAANPDAACAMIAAVLVAAWKALPVATRDAIERRAPRVVGIVRMIGALAPDVIAAMRAARVQVVLGTPKRPTAPPPAQPPSHAGFTHTAAMWTIALVTLALAAAVGVHGCSDPVRRAATITVVSAGSAVAELRAHNRASYVSATNELRYEMADAGGTIEQYDARVAPIDAAYRGRSEAIRALTSDLYAAAAVIDAAHKGDMASVLVAARHALTGLRATVAVLRDGSVLPALPIPDEITDAMDALATMAGAR